MLDDPHAVLGISKDASQDEIKRAYRKKAKEYHPDLHPNDPVAAKKMNEVNEAYDMLTNPEKYAARRTQEQQQQQQRTAYQQRYGQQGSTGYRGSGGWYSDFEDFDFGDIFGFGFGGTSYADPEPQEMPDDSPAIRQAVRDINNRQYSAALERLSFIQSTGRNARWYYLSSLANKGLGNTMQALEHIQRAVQLEPDNAQYRQVLQSMKRSQQTYQRNAQGYDMGAMDMQKLCMGLCAANFFCTFCRCC